MSAEVKSFSATKVEALNLRKSLQTEDNLSTALKHCFLFQGDISLTLHSIVALSPVHNDAACQEHLLSYYCSLMRL